MFNAIKDNLHLRLLEISNVHTCNHTSLNFAIKKVCISLFKCQKRKKNSPNTKNPNFSFEKIFEFLILFSRLCRKWIFLFFCTV